MTMVVSQLESKPDLDSIPEEKFSWRQEPVSLPDRRAPHTIGKELRGLDFASRHPYGRKAYIGDRIHHPFPFAEFVEPHIIKPQPGALWMVGIHGIEIKGDAGEEMRIRGIGDGSVKLVQLPTGKTRKVVLLEKPSPNFDPEELQLPPRCRDRCLLRSPGPLYESPDLPFAWNQDSVGQLIYTTACFQEDSRVVNYNNIYVVVGVRTQDRHGVSYRPLLASPSGG